jgi:Cytochrome oxidase complex assembly protein 1
VAPTSLPAFDQKVSPPPKSWFEKNWKWFVPVVTGGALLLAFAFVAAVYLFASSIIRNTFPYHFATQHALESSVVSERLGAPLHIGWFIVGQINYTNSDGTAYLRIPISGPKGKGTIVLEGKRSEGHWNFETLEVDVAGSSEPINLLEESPPASDDSSPNTT